MQNNPRVTVCIPVYNGERFIKRAIDCILNQTYKELELIIIDNCSTDKTLEIVKSVKDDRISIISNEKNVGMAANFNNCFRYNNSDYFYILCSDDVIDKDCIRKKVYALEENKACSFATSATNIFNSREKLIFVRKNFKKSGIINGKKALKKSFRKFNMFGEPSNVLMRSSCAKCAGIFEEKLYYSIDWEYWLRLCNVGDVYYIDSPLSSFYLRDGSESSKLLKNLKRIIDDDKCMVNLCKTNFEDLSRTDVIDHKISFAWRLIKKWCFSILF